MITSEEDFSYNGDPYNITQPGLSQAPPDPPMPATSNATLEINDSSQYTDITAELEDRDLSTVSREVHQHQKQQNNRGEWGSKVEFMLSSISYAVGLGNIWRFPYLCYINGGGAFLIPYVIMLAFIGLPLFLLELSLGQFAAQGPITVWKCAPMFKGIGYTMVTIGVVISTYYNVIIAFTIFYFFASFQSHLPWKECHSSWASDACVDLDTGDTYNNSTNITSLPDGVLPLTPAEDYWERYVLDLSDGIHHLGRVRWHLALCLILAWTVVFLCIMKGIKTSGKVVYFTATFPYIVLVILFIRGVSLPGAADGLKFYLVPKFHKLKHAKVWQDAAVQILYSLSPGFGGLLTMASYNKFHNNVHRDTLIIAFINCGTSVFAGFVIFSVLGYMAHVTHQDVANVTHDGAGLAFVVYPQALSMMPGSSFWSVLFFFMLFTLGLGSQFAGMQSIITAVSDEYKWLREHKVWFSGVVCGVLYLLGLPCITRGGQYVIEMLDGYVTSLALLTVTLTECLVISWLYGYKRFVNDIYTMVGFRVNIYWVACWTVITPALLIFVLLFMLIDYSGIEFQGVRFPTWAEAIVWIIAAIPVSMIPIWMLIKIRHTCGSFKEFWMIIRGPRDLWRPRLQALWVPAKDWGPAANTQIHAHTQGGGGGVANSVSLHNSSSDGHPPSSLPVAPRTPPPNANHENENIVTNGFSYNTLDASGDSYI